MAEDKKAMRSSGSSFVSKLVSDPANPPDLIRLTGYSGASSLDNHSRLYANPELSVYWDIPEADILHQEAVPQDSDPLGAVTLWVKRNSKMVCNLAGKGAEQPMYTTTPYCYPGAGAGAYGAAPQGFTPPTLTPPTFTPPTFTPPTLTPPTLTPPTLTPPHSVTFPCVSPIPIHCTFPPSPAVICTLPPPSPIPVHCTIAPTPLHQCPTPFPNCVITPVCTIVASPNCTQPTTFPTTFPTTQPTTVTTVETGVGGGFAAAPQMAMVGHYSPDCFPSEVIRQCSAPIACTHPTPIPFCTYPTATINTYPTHTITTYPTYTGGTWAGRGAAMPQAAAAAPQGMPRYSPDCLFPSEVIRQCSMPIICTHVVPTPLCPNPSPIVTCPPYSARPYCGGWGGYGGYPY